MTYSPSKTTLEHVLSVLTREVPAPAPKHRKSFATLKPNDALQGPQGPLIVTAVDDQGATLSNGIRLSRDWKDQGYTKLRKKRRPKP